MALPAPLLKCRGVREPSAREALSAITTDKSLETLLPQPPVQLWCLTWQFLMFLV